MTLLAVCIGSTAIEEILAQVELALEKGAALIELRLDLMEGVSAEELRNVRERVPGGVPILATLRSIDEGGAWEGDDRAYLDRLIDFVVLADYVDVEFDRWRRSDSVRREVTAALRRAGHVSQAGGVETIELSQRRRLILSRHDPRTRPATLQADLVAMLDEPDCSVVKLAWRARSVRDNFEAMELMRDAARPLVAVCMGDEGRASRVLAPKFGGFCTFASPASGRTTAEGQLAIDVLKSVYRWDAIGSQTAVYGLIGFPVEHSIGPHAHNAAFAATHTDAVYLPFPVRPGYESFKAFMVEILDRPWLNFRGASVTIPHKENAFRFLSESGGLLDPAAKRIGAVNTLTFDGAAVRGANADAPAVVDAIIRGFDVSAESLPGRRVLVLGAGGAARAAVSACADAGMHVTIANRTDAVAEHLATTFGCGWAGWAGRGGISCDALINCTSVGMTPAVDESPMEAADLPRGALVIDLVYNPLETRLLRDSAARGCRTVNGLEVYLAQAALQFRAWTGQDAPPTLRSAATAALEHVT